MSILCLFFGIFLSILGMVELIKKVMFKIFFSKRTVPTKTIKIPIYGHCENIEFVVRKILFKYNWALETPRVQIKILDNGSDEETIRICKYLSNEFSSVRLVQVPNFLNSR